MRFDYTAVGHVTADVMPDGSPRVGGGAFYSALQAARLGLRTLILTRGVADEIEALLAPYRGELALEILPAPQTTTLETAGAGAARVQRVLKWAGPIDEGIVVDTAVLHLAPVARETPRHFCGGADFIALTPQGLVRMWEEPGGQMRQAPLARAMLPERCDAIVISESERESCAPVISEARQSTDGEGALPASCGAIVAITAQASPTTVLLPGGGLVEVPVPAIGQVQDDVGAGDVFAAAFFVALHEQRSPRQAAAFANAAAAVRIAGTGADAVGDRSAVEARLQDVASVSARSGPEAGRAQAD